MNFIQLLSIEVLLSFALVCGIIMYNKPLLKSGIIFLTAPLSFILTGLLLSTGVLGFVGDLVIRLISNYVLSGEIMEQMPGTLDILSSVVTAVANIVLYALFFWLIEMILLIVVNVVFGIINKQKAKKAKKTVEVQESDADKEEKNQAVTENNQQENAAVQGKIPPVVLKLSTAAIGGLFGIFMCVLSFYPMITLFNTVHPSFERAWDEQHEQSHLSDIAHSVHDDFLGKIESNAIFSIGHISPFSNMFDLADGLVADMTLSDGGENEVEYNVLDTIGHVVSDSVDIVTVYEYLTLSSDHSLSELALACDVLNDISTHPELLTIMVEAMEVYMSDNESEEGVFNLLSDLLLSEYEGGNIGAISNDINVVSNVLSMIIIDGEDVKVDSLKDYMYGYISDEEKMKPVITELSHFNSYSKVTMTITEYIVNGLCNDLGIYQSEEEFKEEFMEALGALMYDGKAQTEVAEEFIVYSAENKIPMHNYVPGENGEGAPSEAALIHCKEYISDYRSAVSLFNEYYFDCQTDVYYYSKSQNVFFKYLEKEGYWQRVDEKTPSVAIIILEMTEWYETLPENLSGNEVVALFNRINLQYMTSAYGALDEELINDVCRFANDVATAASRDFGIVTKDMVVTSLNNQVTDEQFASESETFANLLTGIGVIIKVGGDSSTSVEGMLSSFGDVGYLMDVLHELSYTEKLPGELLKAISQHRSYRKYFDRNSIEEMIENRNNGTTRFADIFSAVQALFEIANQVK